MNMPPPSDTQERVDTKIDALLEKLNALSEQVDTVAEQLTRRDAAAVRKVFEERERGAGGG